MLPAIPQPQRAMPNVGSLMLTCLVSAGLAACASADYSRARLTGVVGAGIGSPLRLGDPDSAAHLPPGVRLEDGLTADEAAQTALWNSPTFRAELAALELARAGVVEAQSLADPVLSIVFPGDATEWKGTLSWPLQLLQLPSRIKSARLAADEVVHRTISHGLALERDTRVAHARLLLARRSAELRREDAALAEQMGRIAQARYSAGQISAVANQEQLAIAAATAVSSATAEHSAVVAESELLRLMGLLGEPGVIDVVGSDALPKPATVEGAQLRALETRPELRAARLALDRAGAERGLQRAQVISLAALIDLDKQPGESLSQGPGVAISLPLFNGNRAGRARAAAALERAALEYVAARQSVIAEVRDAHAALQSALASLDAQRDRVLPAAEAGAERARVAQAVGHESQLVALRQQRALMAARVAQAEAMSAVRVASASLQFSMGGGRADEQE